MIGASFTAENLATIKQAMEQIKPIDRSEYWQNYYNEVIQRLERIKKEQN